jgi:hypothetical protein
MVEAIILAACAAKLCVSAASAFLSSKQITDGDGLDENLGACTTSQSSVTLKAPAGRAGRRGKTRISVKS